MRRLASIAAFVLLLVPTLARAKGKTELTLTMPTEGARILVDGEQKVKRAAQQVRLSVSHGKHTLRVELDGYQPVERHVTLKSSATSMDIKMLEDLPLAPDAPKAPPAPVFSNDLPMPSAPAEAPAATPAQGNPLRIAVMEVRSDSLGAELATALTTAILEDTRKRPDVTAVGQEELFYRLTSAQRTKVRGCKDDGCFTTLGFTLFVDELLISRVTSLSERRLFTVERLDVTKGIVRGSVTRSAAVGQEEQLLAQLLPALDELYGVDKPVVQQEPRAVSTAVVEQYQRRPPLHPAFFGATAGLAVAAGVVGGVFGALSNSNMKSYNNAAVQSATQPLSARDLDNFRVQSVSQAQTANIAFIAAGVFVVGAGVEAIFTNWSGRSAPTESKAYGARITPTGLEITWR